MKNIIKKSITVITMLAVILTLAMPVTAEAASKKTPKLNKTKVTLTITKKKTKPAYQLKVKNTAGKKVKWTTSNKKVATVSAKGKVVAKKKGSAVIKAKVGKKTLTCKVTVKDNRKTAKTPVKTPTPTPVPTEEPTECQHIWEKHFVTTGTVYTCNCGQQFNTPDEWSMHSFQKEMEGDNSHGSFGSCPITTVDYEYCTKCGTKRNVQ